MTLALDAGLPANIDAERTILGAILLDNVAFDEASRSLQPGDFSLDSHQRIFLRTGELQASNHAVDIVTLAHELARHKEIEAIGGVAYLASLTEGLPLRPVIREYVQIVKDKSLLRKVMVICSAAIARAGDQCETAVEVLGRLTNELEAIPSAVSTARNFFASGADFMVGASEQIDWMVSGVIARGCNGFIAAEPKGAKSWNAADLAIALSAGSSWLDFSVPRPVRVGLVSREDNPALTQWRLNHLRRGRNLTPLQLGYLDQNLYVNTRRETPTLMLDNAAEMEELIGAVRERKLEFILLDVLNVLHSADENNNTEMAAIMRKVRRIQDKTGAAIGILHHYNKTDNAGRITQRLRGASAIADFAEWVIGISLCDEESQMRCMSFEAKTGAPEPIYFCISANDQSARIHRVKPQAVEPVRAERRKGVQ